MKKPKTNIRVKFLYHKKTKDVFAFFVDKEETIGYNTCYSIVGQHSMCSVEYASNCVLANKMQYEPLKKEMESIGYKIEIVT